MNFFEKFLKKASRYLNFVQKVGGYINAHTILIGASQKWDPERLKNGKHALLAKVGAEHVQLKSKTGSLVDGHYLNAATFMQKIENMGGKRLIFETYPSAPPIKKSLLEIDGKPICKLHEISLNDEGLPTDPQVLKELGEETLQIIPDTRTGKLYGIDPAGMQRLCERLGNVDPTEIEIPSFATLKELEMIDPKAHSFPGIKFDKNSSQWKEAVQMFNGMDLDKTAWFLHETDQTVYLMPYKEKETFTTGLNDNQAPLREKATAPLSETTNRGTVLLTMNQSAIYEQYRDEMLTFMLEGLDVMVYNNPGKGLSTGNPDRENINASIEAAYQYLKKRKIPDEKILAKGHSFGGAPTAWLGKKHPKINAMLDQSPANFYDIALERMKMLGGILQEIDAPFFKWFGRMVKESVLINGIARIIFNGYHVDEDLAANKGHKLINISITDNEGRGGDGLVPEAHTQRMIDALQDNPQKITGLSFNPGSAHGDSWWTSPESRESVLQFLKKTKLNQSFFE